MAESSRRWRPALILLALLFAGATLLYSALWIIAVRWQPKLPAVELGFASSNVPAQQAQLVTAVRKNSPAEKAGLLVGDRIAAAGGSRFEDADALNRIWARYQPGEAVRLTVYRSPRADPIVLPAVFRARAPQPIGWTAYFAGQLRNWLPLPFVAVGLTVLFLRLENPNGWLLALMLAAFTTTQGFPDVLPLVPAWRPFAMAFKAVFLALLAAVFYFFFAVFPTRSPIDRRLPWLKWAAVTFGIGVALPGLQVGVMRLPPPLPRLLGENLSEQITLCYAIVFLNLGLVSLIVNYHRTRDTEARRKMRVIFWGTLAGVGPGLSEAAIHGFAGLQAPAWLSTIIAVLMFLLPLSFAYAVIKHRVLDVPVLLKRSARYLLVQRGFILLLALFSAALTLLFALSSARYLRGAMEVAQPAAIALGAAFGTVLFWGGSQVHRQVSGKIDRAFFRNAYDARLILQDLAESSRTATDRGQLAQLLEHHLEQALRPSFLVVYLAGSGNRLRAVSGGWPELAADLPMLAEAARRAQLWEVPSGAALGALQPDSLVPLLGRGGRLAGLLVLGPRLSEEPYSGEDKRLLASVAGQAGTALENIRLAEQIAERMEAERRVAREMEIAQQVQTRLLPQHPPHLETLECAAQCLQARSVGGDYYDFLELGDGRAGFVLADVSGKGVHAALLMASLQAHLRSQSAVAPLDPVRMLEQVNRMLRSSTAAQHYATLFFAIYEDRGRSLRYVNCGHNPPVWLRADGTIERLDATATVIGVFDQWDCSVGEMQLAPGDLLAVFSDGVTEAARGEEEFGEARFIGELRARRCAPVADIVSAVLASVQQFSAGAQSDDLTLLVARGRPRQPQCAKITP